VCDWGGRVVPGGGGWIREEDAYGLKEKKRKMRLIDTTIPPFSGTAWNALCVI